MCLHPYVSCGSSSACAYANEIAPGKRIAGRRSIAYNALLPHPKRNMGGPPYPFTRYCWFILDRRCTVRFGSPQSQKPCHVRPEPIAEAVIATLRDRTHLLGKGRLREGRSCRINQRYLHKCRFFCTKPGSAASGRPPSGGGGGGMAGAFCRITTG